MHDINFVYSTFAEDPAAILAGVQKALARAQAALDGESRVQFHVSVSARADTYSMAGALTPVTDGQAFVSEPEQKAELVTAKPKRAKAKDEPAAEKAPEPTPEEIKEAVEGPEVPTRDDLIALLNLYTSKHPDKAAGTRKLMGEYGGTRLSDIAETEWPALYKALRDYLGV